MPASDSRTASDPSMRPSFHVEQPDSAKWAVYEDPEDIRRFTIVTSAGNELLQGQDRELLRSLVHQYRAAEIGSIALLGENPDIRRELGRGQEAIVYSMGPYAVREERSMKGVYVALGELGRMDAINTVIDEGVPRWLNLPAHYALHSDPVQQKTYTLMDRVDGGLTVEDIQAYPELPEPKKVLVERELGDNTGIREAQERVPELYDEAHDILSSSIKASGQDPEKFLTDWKPRNVVVERLKTPVAGSKYSLNVIDQYRS